MLDVGELLDDHEAIDAGGKGVTNAVDVVAGEVNEHDVFGAILDAIAEGLGKSFVAGRGFATLNCAGNWMGDNAAFFGFDEEFRRGANELEGGTIDIEEIGGGVDGAKMAVYVERVK